MFFEEKSKDVIHDFCPKIDFFLLTLNANSATIFIDKTR